MQLLQEIQSMMEFELRIRLDFEGSVKFMSMVSAIDWTVFLIKIHRKFLLKPRRFRHTNPKELGIEQHKE